LRANDEGILNRRKSSVNVSPDTSRTIQTSSTRRWLPKLAGISVVLLLIYLILDFLWLSNMSTIQVGERAPDFSVETHTGAKVSLSDYRGKQAVVLYFYPRDNTSVCTAQACAFRDSYADFSKYGAVVLGVSGDSAERHRAFAEKQELPYLLVADEDGSLRKAYGVSNRLGLIPRRVTFVIDREGVVRSVYEAMFEANSHIEGARKVVKELAAEEA
jgi:peroxiredoxin Q/BCP